MKAEKMTLIKGDQRSFYELERSSICLFLSFERTPTA